MLKLVCRQNEHTVYCPFQVYVSDYQKYEIHSFLSILNDTFDQITVQEIPSLS